MRRALPLFVVAFLAGCAADRSDSAAPAIDTQDAGPDASADGGLGGLDGGPNKVGGSGAGGHVGAGTGGMPTSVGLGGSGATGGSGAHAGSQGAGAAAGSDAHAGSQGTGASAGMGAHAGSQSAGAAAGSDAHGGGTTNGGAAGSDGVAGHASSEGGSPQGTGGTGGGFAEAGTGGVEASAGTSSGAGGSATDAIEEADVIALEGTRLYTLSRFSGLTVLDVTDPDAPAILGRQRLDGVPFEMYVDGGVVIAMSSGHAHVTTAGNLVTTSTVTQLDATDPTHILAAGSVDVPGSTLAPCAGRRDRPSAHTSRAQ